jgi:hypothetical protein
MASLTPEVQQFIMRNRLGPPLKIYGPHTILSIIGGLFFTTFALFWTWFALSFFSSSLLPPNLSAFNMLLHTTPSSFLPSSPDSTFNTMFTIFSIVFPLFGLLFFFIGLWIILSAIYNHDMRAVVCTYGVVSARPSGIDSFRWQDVLTTFHKVHVSTSTSYNQSSGYATTRTSVHHTYTVHCYDGRKFIFKSPLAHVQDLGEDIEVQVARIKQPQSQQRMYR